ncbi:AraC family transcriptional regulator [Chitinophaga sp. 212800008-4]|uniref:helix-turn-helix transcriptional regulator n=1 Tax=unclassified Chitinophaga TaxID=2619133 RepID=UPI0030CC0BB0
MENSEPSYPTYEAFTSLPVSAAPLVFDFLLPEVKGRMRMMKLGAIHVSDGQLEISGKAAHDTQLRHYNDHPCIEMNFMLEGNILQQHSHLSEKLYFTRGYHNVMFNQGEWEQNQYMGSGIHNNFTINIHTSRFLELFSAYAEQLDDIAGKVARGEPFLLHRPELPFTPQMLQVIHNIWNNPLSGTLQNLYLETKTTELLLLQWEQFTRPRKAATVLKSREDIARIHLAREILLNNIQQPPSLAQLAQQCGVNEFKLKKGFRELFNDTVFGYLHELRLEQARQLVLDTDMSMAEIAAVTGYAHSQHFHRAFRQRYGTTPLQLRK